MIKIVIVIIKKISKNVKITIKINNNKININTINQIKIIIQTNTNLKVTITKINLYMPVRPQFRLNVYNKNKTILFCI